MLIEGQPAATATSTATLCVTPGSLCRPPRVLIGSEGRARRAASSSARGWGFPIVVKPPAASAGLGGDRLEQAIHLDLDRSRRAADAARIRVPIHDHVFAPADGRLPGASPSRCAGSRPVGAGHHGRRACGSPSLRAGALWIDSPTRSGHHDPRNLVFPFYVIPDEGCPHPPSEPDHDPSGAHLDDRRSRACRRRQAADPPALPRLADHNVSDPGVTLSSVRLMTDLLPIASTACPTATT